MYITRTHSHTTFSHCYSQRVLSQVYQSKYQNYVSKPTQNLPASVVDEKNPTYLTVGVMQCCLTKTKAGWWTVWRNVTSDSDHRWRAGPQPKVSGALTAQLGSALCPDLPSLQPAVSLLLNIYIIGPVQSIVCGLWHNSELSTYVNI